MDDKMREAMANLDEAIASARRSFNAGGFSGWELALIGNKLDLLKDALAQQPVSVPEETAWLIEMREGIHPVKWLGGTKVHYPWTTDAMAAVRFKGRKDAQYVIDNCPPFYPGGAELFATEHIFMLSAAPQEDQP